MIMEEEVSSDNIAKAELIAKLKELIDKAKGTPLNELCEVGDYRNNPGLKHPQTRGESIVADILSLLLPQPWIDSDSEPLLDEICSVASQLDVGVDSPEDWKSLFDLSARL
jgi:lambda repressor-like predicted transcriptional regulator